MEIIEEYKLELEKELEAVKTSDNEKEIQAKLAEYEKSLRDEFEADKKSKIEKLTIKIECLVELAGYEEEHTEKESENKVEEEENIPEEPEFHTAEEPFQPTAPNFQ